jgi:hypothetical protein
VVQSLKKSDFFSYQIYSICALYIIHGIYYENLYLNQKIMNGHRDLNSQIRVRKSQADKLIIVIHHTKYLYIIMLNDFIESIKRSTNCDVWHTQIDLIKKYSKMFY